MRFRRLEIRVQTSDGPYGVTLDFPDGLVLIWADNSMGKSTCVKAMLIALGMEAMLTTSQVELPIAPSVKTRLESPTGEHDVLESEVFLEIENAAKHRIVVRRAIKGSRDKNLITVYDGAALTATNSPGGSRDFFVNRAGAATRELGFHAYLAEFFGWELPAVRTYDGDERPLYFQCILPYLIVEQTRGWATTQPPVPTHFRLRDPNKRAVEFLLALDAHAVALKRQGLQAELARIDTVWRSQFAAAMEFAERTGGKIFELPSTPVATWPPTMAVAMVLPHGETWVDLEVRIVSMSAQLRELVENEIPRVKDISSSAQVELTQAELLVRDRQSLLSRLLDTLEMDRREIGAIAERLRAIDEDIQRNKDARVLTQLGSTQDLAFDKGSCPVCHQTIQDTLVPLEPDQAVMSLEESIAFLGEQRRTYGGVYENAKRELSSREKQVQSLRVEVSALRDRVRVLRQTLVSDGRGPSIAAIEERLRLDGSIRNLDAARAHFDTILESFAELARAWSTAQSQLNELPRVNVTTRDSEKISSWSAVLRDQLRDYGFASFKPDQAQISADSYRPEHDGFDLQNTISASDLIRTIWSYLKGMLELSRSVATNHPGFLIFDEPRQQSTKDFSFGKLIQRSADASAFHQQVIFFTSEDRNRLRSHLDGLPHTFYEIDGRVLKRL